jgi:chromosome segregation ATPase
MNTINTGIPVNSDPNLLRAGYNGLDETKVVADTKQATLAPILFGSNILVSYGISDAEALVARLKNENADTHVQMKLKALSAVASGITAQQLRALSQALALAESVKSLEMTRDGLARTVDIDNSLITELALKTATLEEEIKTARENQELYNKQIEKQKADRAELQDKINKLEADTEHDNADEIAALKEQVKALDKSITENTAARDKLTQEIKEKDEMVSAFKAESDEYKKLIAEAPGMIETAKKQIAALHAQLAPLIASIGESTLKALAEDILGIDPPDPDSPQDRRELEKNTEEMDVLSVIRDRLDALAKSILDEVAEKRVDMV